MLYARCCDYRQTEPQLQTPDRSISWLNTSMASPLEEVAAKISTEVASLTRLLQERGAPTPSFAESSAVDTTKPPDDAALVKAKNELVNAAHDLLRLAQGPVDHLVTLGYAVSKSKITGMQVLINRPSILPT
jgi:hypothetical protein